MHTAFSLSYLTASSLTPPQAVAVAAQAGYSHVGLRLCASVPGAAFQDLLGDAYLMRETLACMQGTGIGVFDVEVIRIGENFEASAWLPLLAAGAVLKARGVLVVGDDPDQSRLAQSFARICELALPFALTVDLEFLPWTAIRDVNSALRILEASGMPPNAGLLVDALHMARSTSTLTDIAALPRSCLHYAQICDGPGSGTSTREEMIHTAVAERLLPGEGSIDLEGLFGALPPGLPVSVEIPHHVRLPKLGALEWARQALAASHSGPASSTTTPCSPRPCWTACCTTPRPCASRARATARKIRLKSDIPPDACRHCRHARCAPLKSRR